MLSQNQDAVSSSRVENKALQQLLDFFSERYDGILKSTLEYCYFF